MDLEVYKNKDRHDRKLLHPVARNKLTVALKKLTVLPYILINSKLLTHAIWDPASGSLGVSFVNP